VVAAEIGWGRGFKPALVFPQSLAEKYGPSTTGKTLAGGSSAALDL